MNNQEYLTTTRYKQSSRIQKTQIDTDQDDQFASKRMNTHRKKESIENLFHSQLNYREQQETTDQLRKQNQELQKTIKIKELNYDQIAKANYQVQKANDELKSQLQLSCIEIQKMESQVTQQIGVIQHKEFQLQDSQELIAQYQHENARQKILITKLNDDILQKKTEIKKYKDQLDTVLTCTSAVERGRNSSKHTLDNFDEIPNPNSQSISLINPTRKESSELNYTNNQNSKQYQQYQIELRRYQQQIQEKNSIINTLMQQVQSLTQLQQKLTSSTLCRSPDEIQKFNLFPVQSNIDLDRPDRLLSNCRSDQRFVTPNNNMNIGTPSDNKQGISLKSQISNKNKKELKQIYQKINQSTRFTAGLYSTMLDYQFLDSRFQNCRILSDSTSKENPTLK